MAPKPPVVRGRAQLSNGLPTYSSAVEEKIRASPWISTVSLPIPGIPTRRLRIPIPNPARVQLLSAFRFWRKRGPWVFRLTVLLIIFILYFLTTRMRSHEQQWSNLFSKPATLVFRREDLQRIWKWEVESGHYPSSQESECPYVLIEPSPGVQWVSSPQDDRFENSAVESSVGPYYVNSLTV